MSEQFRPHRAIGDKSAIAVAFHEAGHAIAAIAFGGSVHRITIVPTKKHLGRCDSSRKRWDAREVTIAGPIAETIAGDDIDMYDEEVQQAVRDFQERNSMTYEDACDSVYEWQERIQRMMICDRKWRQCFERLVPALLQHNRLDGADVHRLVGRLQPSFHW